MENLFIPSLPLWDEQRSSISGSSAELTMLSAALTVLSAALTSAPAVILTFLAWTISCRVLQPSAPPSPSAQSDKTALTAAQISGAVQTHLWSKVKFINGSEEGKGCVSTCQGCCVTLLR